MYYITYIKTYRNAKTKYADVCQLMPIAVSPKRQDAKLCQCMPAYADGKQRYGRRSDDEDTG